MSWNLRQLDTAWRTLSQDASLDIALVQEARRPPTDVELTQLVPSRDDDWTMPGYRKPFRTAIARLSNRVSMRPIRTVELGSADRDALPVSYAGSLTAADLELDGAPCTLISVYAPWQDTVGKGGWSIISDAFAHRVISDLSALITSVEHRLIVAGDFNILRGHGENGDAYWGRRYATVFARMEALGLRCLGPEAPHGRQAAPWPDELPTDSKNVPTYHSNRQDAASATRQLDFVFASERLADRISVRALNGVEEWGSSDHCRLLIEIADSVR